MVPWKTLACVALAAPLAAAAQVSRSQVVIVPEGRDLARECHWQNDELHERRARIDRDQREVGREAAAIERASIALAEELRSLDHGDARAVSDYNARSSRHNRRVAEHNRRVADLNASASVLNGDTDELASRCAGRWR